MHYYKKNIGDYHKRCGRLSMLEHGAYTLLMDSCYDRERFPTIDEAIEWCWARTDEEINAVKFVLKRFFEEVDGVYMQRRIEDELASYHEKSTKNRQIALEREEARRTKREKDSTKRATDSTKRARDDHEPPPNQEPLTTNHELETTNNKPSIKTLDQPAVDHGSLFDRFWSAGMRKVNKQKSESLFAKIVKKQPDPEEFTGKLCEDIRNRLASGQLGFTEMHPTTYLNGERWTDEIAQPRARSPDKAAWLAQRDADVNDWLNERHEKPINGEVVGRG